MERLELIDQGITILTTPDEFKAGLKRVETMGRICYQSANLSGGDDKTEKFIKMLIASHHESVLEHCTVSAILVTDRAVTHQLVRHRLCAFSQESQRYCNYSLGKFGSKITYIKPIWFDQWSESSKQVFLDGLKRATDTYFNLLEQGRPEEARAILPNACKTQIGITTNLRELRHILKERCSKAAQAQIRQLALAVREILPDMITSDIQCSYDGGSYGLISTNGVIRFGND